MKNKRTFSVLAAFLVAAAFVFSGLHFSSVNSIDQLNASAIYYCTPGPSDCLSPVTENIYTGYVPVFQGK
jgi:hypothetical protein